MDEIKNDLSRGEAFDPLPNRGSQTNFFLRVKNLLGLECRPAQFIFAGLLGLIALVATLSFFLSPPAQFVPGTTVVVKEGSSLGQVSLLLQEQNLIRSRVLFEFCAITLGGDKRVIAGEYLFKNPVGSCEIASRIVRGILGVPAVRVTIPEGTSNKEMAVILGKALPQFDTAAFLASSRGDEGYLFPDTYFFSKNATVADVETLMKENFQRKIKPLGASIAASGHSLHDIVIMASILEKEVATDKDRAIVSGILWKRIDLSMPLQVDATFAYLLDKQSSELTQADLNIASPYNTYRNKGLPPGPISNPGLSALRAAITPLVTPYLYYLADKNGVTHYATTFNEHKANKEKYL